MKATLLFLLFCCYAPLSFGQAQADVASPDALIEALYESISGPAGERDWDRFRHLMYPNARLIPVQSREDSARAVFFSPEEYIEQVIPYFEENGFFEVEISRETASFGNILHAFSTYESRHKADDPAPFSRGINSIQLMHDGQRWWLINIFWDAEREGLTIPARYLPE